MSEFPVNTFTSLISATLIKNETPSEEHFFFTSQGTDLPVEFAFASPHLVFAAAAKTGLQFIVPEIKVLVIMFQRCPSRISSLFR